MRILVVADEESRDYWDHFQSGRLDDIDLMISDLMQTGFSTGGEAARLRAEELALRCGSIGLHTAKTILDQVASELRKRTYLETKDDQELMALLCKCLRYTELARQRLQENSIRQRWENVLKEGM